MKIVQVQTQAEAAGAQRISDMLGESLRQRGHDIRTVFMYRKTAVYDEDRFADFILKHRPRGPLDQMRAVLGLISYMRAARPDAVICFQHYGNIFGTIAGRLAGAPRLIANQSGAPHKRGALAVTTWVDRIMGTLGLYHLSIVNSAWTEAQFADFPAAYRSRIRRIDHGVTGPEQTVEKHTARNSFGLPLGAPLVVSTGRQTRQKNQAVLVAALPLLPGVHLALAGIGPERETLLGMARDLQVSDRLHLVGEVPPARIYEFLAAGDVFAFPSQLETFGLSAVEAAISGLPIVASTLPVLQEVLSDDAGASAALFANSEDAVGIAKAIARYLAEPDLVNSMTATGRRLAARYTPTRMGAAYERLLAP